MREGGGWWTTGLAEDGGVWGRDRRRSSPVVEEAEKVFTLEAAIVSKLKTPGEEQLEDDGGEGMCWRMGDWR